MRRIKMTGFAAGLFLALVLGRDALAQPSRNQTAGPCDSTPVNAQANGLIDRDAVTRAEERLEALRVKLLDLQMEEIGLQAQLEDLDYWLTPEAIQRAIILVGSVRPMDELRQALRLRLESQKARVNKQLELLASTRERLESAISEAEAELERIHQL